VGNIGQFAGSRRGTSFDKGSFARRKKKERKETPRPITSCTSHPFLAHAHTQYLPSNPT